MIALNRKLDEIDRILSPNFQVPHDPRILSDEGQLNSGNADDPEPGSLCDEQIAKDPLSSNWLETPEIFMHANEQRLELWPQFNEAMEQLRQRQKETKV